MIVRLFKVLLPSGPPSQILVSHGSCPLVPVPEFMDDAKTVNQLTFTLSLFPHPPIPPLHPRAFLVSSVSQFEASLCGGGTLEGAMLCLA